MTLTVVNHTTATGQFTIDFANISQIINTGALTFTGTGTVRIKGFVIRVTSTTCRAEGEIIQTGSATIATALPFYVPDSTLTGLTLTGTNAFVLKAAATGTGAASGDITIRTGSFEIKGFGS